jgi:hypothetical protein
MTSSISEGLRLTFPSIVSEQPIVFQDGEGPETDPRVWAHFKALIKALYRRLWKF